VYEYLPQEHAVVMEYIKGVELREIIDTLNEKSEKIFVDTAVEMGCELADALFYAYTALGKNRKPLQLVHRDIKPSNIIMTEEGSIKILDFGLADVHNEGFTQDRSDSIKGTPIYMAPEQVFKRKLDHRTDLFALGLILYELLMGEPAYRIPYDAKDPIQAIFQDIKQGTFNFDVEGLQRRLPNIGPTIAKLLKHEPAERFQNGQELLMALRSQLPKTANRSYIEEFAKYYFSQISPKSDDYVDRKEQKIQNMSIIETLPPKKNLIQPEKKVQSIRKQHDSSFVIRESGVQMTNKPKPPVGGAAFRSNKDVRTPNDDGMLDFVPNSGSINDEEEAATQFFTIPAPQQNTTPEKNASLNSSPGGFGQFGGQPGMNSGNYPNPSYGGQPGMNQGGFSAPNPYGGAGQGGIGQGGQGGIGQGGIGQGGIGQGGIGQGRMNQNVHPDVRNTTTEIAPGEASMKSNRIWIILAAVFVLLLISIFTVIYVAKLGGKDIKSTDNKQEVGSDPIKEKVIEEEEEEEEEELVRTKTKIRTKTTRKVAVTTPQAKTVQGGTMTVKIKGEASQVTLIGCGKRQRKKIGGSSVSFSNVPVDTCTLKFAPSSVFTTVKGGAKTVTCTINGNSVICR
jgi:serine/threonine protein kinase